jgi:hypothetical protein
MQKSRYIIKTISATWNVQSALFCLFAVRRVPTVHIHPSHVIKPIPDKITKRSPTKFKLSSEVSPYGIRKVVKNGAQYTRNNCQFRATKKSFITQSLSRTLLPNLKSYPELEDKYRVEIRLARSLPRLCKNGRLCYLSIATWIRAHALYKTMARSPTPAFARKLWQEGMMNPSQK